MARSDPKQGQRRALRAASALLPVAQRVNADPECLRKPVLGQSDEVPEGNDVPSPGDAPAEHSLPLLPRDRPLEVLLGQIINVILHAVTL
jgi:hypothetical protein